MKPYYEHAGITIYHGDCREILGHLPKVDLVLTDPYYGISYSPGSGGSGWIRGGGKTYSGKNIIFGDDKPFDPSILMGFSKCIIWGGNHFANKLPASPSWLVWFKRFTRDWRPVVTDFADCEIAWSNLGNPARVFVHLWNGLLRDSEKAVHFHPAQKPLALMKWCIELAGAVDIILDPFMGSGTTLVAAKQLGRKAIGIEIEEKYCEIAVKRLAQEVLPLQIA